MIGDMMGGKPTGFDWEVAFLLASLLLALAVYVVTKLYENRVNEKSHDSGYSDTTGSVFSPQIQEYHNSSEIVGSNDSFLVTDKSMIGGVSAGQGLSHRHTREEEEGGYRREG